MTILMTTLSPPPSDVQRAAAPTPPTAAIPSRFRALRRLGGMAWTGYRRFNKELVRALLPVIRPARNHSLRIERIGTDYGGWHVPVDLIDAEWICYGVGVGCDATFDVGLTERFGCHVFAFDPTPRAIDYMAGLDFDENLLTFVPVGMWTEDTTLRFFAPADPDATSHSVYDLGGTARAFDAPVRRLSTLASDLGHDRVDLLKFDVEGAWRPIVDALAAESLRPRVLCAEFDSPTSIPKVLRAIRTLGDLGYELLHYEKENFLFVQRSDLPA